MPFYEAVRAARRVLLLGDLGSGKSTLAATLVIETIDRSETAVAIYIPVKNLRLAGQPTLREILQSIDDYIIKEVLASFPEVKLSSLLENEIEVLIVLDG
jgi:type II secretory pathway predicted ATPase ExeA